MARHSSASRHPNEPAPRRGAAPLTGVVLLALTVAHACSHYDPYYGGGAGRWAEWVADGDVAHRLLLIGDAGDPDPEGEPALAALQAQVNRIPTRTTVVFLGDNLYEAGMPPPAPPPDPATEVAVEVAQVLVTDVIQTRKEAERKLDAQIAVVRGNGARAVFIPGNHDWDQFGLSGREEILELERYLRDVRERDGLDISLLPSGGCPGPVSVALADRGELIAIDTQWWLEKREKDRVAPDNNPSGCPYTTEAEVHGALRDALHTAARDGRRAVVVGHHPLESRGSHAGFVDPLVHLFPAKMGAGYVPIYVEWLPMPLIGSLAAGVRACCSPSAQDMPNDWNRHMRAAVLQPMVEAAEQDARPLVYAAGHDHNLQVFRSDVGPAFILVSGLGVASQASPVGDNAQTLFAHSSSDHPGFMQMDFLTDGRVRLAVIEYAGEDNPAYEVFSRFLVE